MRSAAFAFVPLTLMFNLPAHAQRESIIVENSVNTIVAMMRDPNFGPPPQLIRSAQGLIIFPNLLQGGFLFGVRHGRGIVVMRDESGHWANPFFIRVTGGNVGLLAGGQANEVVLLFRNRETIDRFLLGQGKLTFGVDASVAAGPVGGGVGADTDPRLRADILTFSRNRGLYAGASIGGAMARTDTRADWAFYGMAVTPPEIVNGVEGLQIPESVARLHQALNAYARAGAPPMPGRPAQPGGNLDDEPIIIEPGPIPGFDDEPPSF